MCTRRGGGWSEEEFERRKKWCEIIRMWNVLCCVVHSWGDDDDSCCCCCGVVRCQFSSYPTVQKMCSADVHWTTWEIINVFFEQSHLYYCERNLIIDNDSGISNLFISRPLHSPLTRSMATSIRKVFDMKIYSFTEHFDFWKWTRQRKDETSQVL